MPVDLSRYEARAFDRGASRLKEALWLLVSFFLFRLCPLKLSVLKCWVLRRFGAHVGRGVVIKPQVKITFPWRLTLGDHVWLGEEAWVLNLAPVRLDNDVCVSQRVFICAGNHDYRSPAFKLVTEPIRIESGAWLAAGSLVGPGVSVGTHAVLSAGSVATTNLEPYGVYQGNPARLIRKRTIEDSPTGSLS